MDYKNKLEKTKTIQEMFEIVKKIGNDFFGSEQAGLLVGLSDLGSTPEYLLGAFYSLDANTIVINKRPILSLQNTNPDLLNPYLFHILLHEYIHSLGFLDEAEVRELAFRITKDYFGEDHIVTQMAFDLSKFIPNLTLGHEMGLPDDVSIEYLSGIDRRNTNYIM